MKDNQNWTFGIVVSNDIFLKKIIDSIKSQSSQNKHEIILVGNKNIIQNYSEDNVRIIEFDENIKKSWITKKKNIITEFSSNENIAYMHDYVYLHPGWFLGFQKFGYDWDVAMNRIENLDGTRFRDWVTWPASESENIEWLSYNDHSKTRDMYVSGTFFCAKKSFMLANKFDESLTWGQGEDVAWSLKARNSWTYKMNCLSRVGFLKQKHKWPPTPAPFEDVYYKIVKESISLT